jgi:hypothetical protein
MEWDLVRVALPSECCTDCIMTALPPNKRVEPNRRPALALDAERQFDGTLWAPPSLSAAVAHPCRYPT